MTTTPSTIDELMSIDPLDMSSTDLDAIIAYHRNNRAKVESGQKLSKITAASPDPKVNLLDALGLNKPKAAAPTAMSFKRR